MRKVNKKWKHEDAGDHVRLFYRDKVVLVDYEDFEIFQTTQVRILDGSCSTPYLYIVGYEKGKHKYETFHRVIMKTPAKFVVDHINGNTLDNRKINLRNCTLSQNAHNSRKLIKNASSKYKGVSKHSGGKNWICAIQAKGCERERYYFKTEIEAAEKYNERALVLHGEFACLNKIERLG